MVLVLALGAAVAYAVAIVLQQRGASQVDAAVALRPALLPALARQPRWVLGIAANVVAFGLRATALGRGSLVLVQPLLLTGFVFALGIEAVAAKRRITRHEATASVAIVAGLAVFLLTAAPTHGITSPSVLSWLVLAGASGPLIVVGVVAGSRRTGDRRAASLALAGGLLLAATAALAKQAAAGFSDNGTRVMLTWVPYGLVIVAGLGVVVVQSAFQAGTLRTSLPVLAVVEPLASMAIGVVVFRERVATSPAALLLEGVGLVILLSGVVAASRLSAREAAVSVATLADRPR